MSVRTCLDLTDKATCHYTSEERAESYVSAEPMGRSAERCDVGPDLQTNAARIWRSTLTGRRPAPRP
jgi:hypothetical protein